MDSLQLAKEGLSQMEDMGMTGKPDEAVMSADEPLPTMAGGGYAKNAALNVPVDTKMFEHGGLHNPTEGTYTVPGQQFATTQAAPVAAGTTVVPSPAPAVQKFTPRAKTSGSYYAIKEYKNPDTGESFYLPTIGGLHPV